MSLISINPISVPVRIARTFSLGLLTLLAALWICARAAAQDPAYSKTTYTTVARQRMHDSDQWAQIQQHLPDPATSSPQLLEQEGDILRARKFPEDAMDYYRYALDRGGNAPSLLNKLGLTELEMRNVELARSFFKRVVKLAPKDGQAWNNLGAVQFIDGEANASVTSYRKAIKLNKHEAVFHANLATAYFETKDNKAARKEITTALKLDPMVFEQRGTGGIAAHVLSSMDRARFSFEMASLFAKEGLEEQMLNSLAKASEAGMDIQSEMRRDAVLAKFTMDPRVVVIVHNAQLVRSHQASTVNPATVKPLAE